MARVRNDKGRMHRHNDGLFFGKYICCFYDANDMFVAMFESINEYASAHNQPINYAYGEIYRLRSGKQKTHIFRGKKIKAYFIEVEEDEQCR